MVHTPVGSASGAPLKVMIVCEACGGGSGRHVLELAPGLVKAGCEVHLVYSSRRADPTFRGAVPHLEGVEKHEVMMRREPHPADLADVIACRRYMMQQGGFDVVHAHSSKAGAIGRLAALGTKAARVYTPHAIRTMDPMQSSAVREFYRAVELALAWTSCDAIIAVSEHEREHIIAQGISASKLHVVVNGLPEPEPYDRGAIRASLGIAPDEICVGFIGRLVPQKAPERFVEMVASLAQRLPKLRGVMLGSGPLQDEVHAAARAAGVYDRLVWVTDRTGPAVLPAYDMLVMPSRYEGMPYVLLEALVVGVPVISADVGGAAEAVEHEVTGFIVPQDQPAQFAERVASLAENPDLLRTMSEASLRKGEQMTIERMIEQTLAVYSTALSRRAPHRQPLNIPVGGLATRRD